MTYSYTDEQLNYLNRDKAVYSVNSEFIIREKTTFITANPNPKPSLSDFKETNTLTTPDGQEFRVIATKLDTQTGFDGMAEALFVND